jgi:hypothetical protein
VPTIVRSALRVHCTRPGTSTGTTEIVERQGRTQKALNFCQRRQSRGLDGLKNSEPQYRLTELPLSFHAFYRTMGHDDNPSHKCVPHVPLPLVEREVSWLAIMLSVSQNQPYSSITHLRLCITTLIVKDEMASEDLAG